MTVKTLKECYACRDRIEWLLEEIMRLRSAIQRLTQELTETPRRGGDKDRMERILDRLDALKEKYERRELDHAELRAEVLEWIDDLPDQQAKIIYKRYVEGMSWRQIARDTHYSEQHCFRIHEAALKKCDGEKDESK